MTDAAGQSDTDMPLPAGTIRVVTDVPVEIDPNEPALLAAARIQLTRRPWVVPALVLGLGAAYLLLRRNAR